MIEIKKSIYPFIKQDTQQIAVRVRWDNKKRTVTFITGYYGEKEKWDSVKHQSLKGWTHKVRKHSATSVDINERIELYREQIEIFFSMCERENRIPTQDELKTYVNNEINPEEMILRQNSAQVKTMEQLFEEFKAESTKEKNWNYLVREKYTQAFNHLMEAVPKLTPETITKKTMVSLRDWYVKEEYYNTTTNHRFAVTKAFFKWINTNTPYKIPDDVLNYKTHLKEVEKTITFLTYEELLHFYNFPFKNDRLMRAKDMFCFMAFTSLRISDLRRLRIEHVVGEHLELFAKKTDEKLVIPLISMAKEIIDRYKDNRPDDGRLFDVITGQKLNEAIQDAAKEAGLNRKIMNAYYIGTERYDETYEYCERISCHDARRTFISNSLAMGIPENFVRRCSGHKNLRTMAPYMGVALEAQTLEMDKWNKNQSRSQIVSALDNLSEHDLNEVLKYINQMKTPNEPKAV